MRPKPQQSIGELPFGGDLKGDSMASAVRIAEEHPDAVASFTVPQDVFISPFLDCGLRSANPETKYATAPCSA